MSKSSSTWSDRPGLKIAVIQSRLGVADGAIASALGMSLPGQLACSTGADLTAVAIGPGCWMVTADAFEGDWISWLRTRLAGLASIFDQSAGYKVLRVQGRLARSLLQMGCPIDLHPSTFPPGSACSTIVAHVGVTIWQPSDPDVFYLAFYRSYSASVEHWIKTSAASLEANQSSLVL